MCLCDYVCEYFEQLCSDNYIGLSIHKELKILIEAEIGVKVSAMVVVTLCPLIGIYSAQPYILLLCCDRYMFNTLPNQNEVIVILKFTF
jgi:hypothetical protein